MGYQRASYREGLADFGVSEVAHQSLDARCRGHDTAEEFRHSGESRNPDNQMRNFTPSQTKDEYDDEDDLTLSTQYSALSTESSPPLLPWRQVCFDNFTI